MPLTLVIILFIFLGALIWLVNWEPAKDDEKKNKDKLEGEIKKLFTEMQMDARTFNREEFVPSLELAQDEVLKVLRERKLVA
ncbi:MAG: hypothetical protein KTR19_02010 [Hyphomicrobiales bacterium]|nr:hypothetical protein [Hyphomicrobiales bacterium]